MHFRILFLLFLILIASCNTENNINEQKNKAILQFVKENCPYKEGLNFAIVVIPDGTCQTCQYIALDLLKEIDMGHSVFIILL
jgi:predicted metal-binding protein